MKLIKKIIKSIVVAFSTYSRLPMPGFKWDSEDMKYHMIFFPWVGLVIGALELVWFYFTNRFPTFERIRPLIALAIPLLVTGGLHVDGFMDTCDGLHSYKSKEDKLNILKDPHIGAFSVICLTIYVLIYLSGVTLLSSFEAYILFAFSFVISRAISAITLMCLKEAKKDGMLYVTKFNSSKKVVLGFLVFELMLSLAVIFYINLYASLIIVILQVMLFLYYKRMSYKEFGGITGDTSGYLLALSENLSVIAIAVFYALCR